MKDKQKGRTTLAVFVAAIASLALSLSGCVTGGTDSVPKTAANANATAAAPPPPPPPPLEAREPESYTITETITIQPTGSTPQANIPPLQFTLARLGADRRLSFRLPEPVGEVIYLEKAPLKYLIFPARNQYVELNEQELGFQLGDMMSPVSIIERLKARAQYETLGTESVAGRTAIKYRFKASADTRTNVGTAQADSILYVDQETGLPLRTEIEATSTSGAGARIVTATENLQLIVSPATFEVPTAMKKVSSTELKQQVQSFVAGLRVFADYLKQQATPPPPPAPAR
jgi:outer membrane lipoprotein-sorting protein